MPLYQLNRTYTLRTPNGVVSFTKNEPVWVPTHLERDAAGIGAVRSDGKHVDMIEPEQAKLPELGADERVSQMNVAFELLIERNDAKDFTGQGVPTVKAVEKIVGFSVERSEVLEAWAAYRVAKAEA